MLFGLFIHVVEFTGLTISSVVVFVFSGEGCVTSAAAVSHRVSLVLLATLARNASE